MRIIVFSDSHREVAPCIRVIKNLIGVDMILHAGDHSHDAKQIAAEFPDIPVKYVVGNCDFDSAPSEMVIEAEGKRIFLTHGHNYNVKNELSYSSVCKKALSENCDCVVFGHTHIPHCSVNGSLSILNPGSIRSMGTYGVIEIEDGKLRTAICNSI